LSRLLVVLGRTDEAVTDAQRVVAAADTATWLDIPDIEQDAIWRDVTARRS
jgi:hypothetical protein